MAGGGKGARCLRTQREGGQQKVSTNSHHLGPSCHRGQPAGAMGTMRAGGDSPVSQRDSLQCNSSLWSVQSAQPSQRRFLWMHRPVLHVNIPGQAVGNKAGLRPMVPASLPQGQPHSHMEDPACKQRSHAGTEVHPGPPSYGKGGSYSSGQCRAELAKLLLTTNY